MTACKRSRWLCKLVSNLLLSLFGAPEGLERWNNAKRRAHRDQLPLSDSLFSLMTIVQVDLTEHQREKLTSHLTLRGVALREYTFDLIRIYCLACCCAPRSSLENPSFRPTGQQRTFYVQDYGELDSSTGYWAVEEETGQEGFVQAFEDTFWVHNEASDDWVARYFKGGRGLIKGSRKGKRTGSKRWTCNTFSFQI